MGHGAGLDHPGGGSVGDGSSILLVAPARVGVVVDARVPGQLVGAAEAFGAAREGAGVGLLSGVGADVTGLVLEAVEGLLAQRALVGPWQVLARLVLGLLGVLEQGRHEAHGGRRHGEVLGGFAGRGGGVGGGGGDGRGDV